MIDDRILPQNLDAERALLGAILVNEDAMALIAGHIEASDFFRDAHQRVYGAMLRLFGQNVVIDAVTLVNELAKHGDLDEVGGPSYVASIMDGVPRSTNVTSYMAIVHEKSQLRHAILAANRLLAVAYAAEDPVEEMVNAAAADLDGVVSGQLTGRAVHVKDLLQDTLDGLERAHRSPGAVLGLPTGYVELDAMTMGLLPSNLTLLAGRPSMGKSSLAMNIAARISRQWTVLFSSLEMSKEELMLRLLTAVSRVDGHRARSGYLGERDWAKLAEAMNTIGDLKLYIDDTPSLTLFALQSRARAVRASHGLHLVIVDYLQLMRGGGRHENRTQEIGAISRGLKGLAKQLAVPVLALCQLKRAVEDRKGRRPVLSDLRESGDLEQDADNVLLIYRDEDLPEAAGLAEIIVAKQRNGPTGTVKLAYLKEFTSFENLASSS